MRPWEADDFFDDDDEEQLLKIAETAAKNQQQRPIVVDLTQEEDEPPQKIPKVNGSPQAASAMASLRPQSWSQGSISHDGTLKPTERKEQAEFTSDDPHQEGLPKELRFSAAVAQDDDHRAELVKHASISQALDNGWMLFNHQKRAILTAIRTRRHILALDMGLGKTLIGCVWAKSFVKTFQCKVICVCPVSLKNDWKRTMENAVGLTVHGPKDKTFTADVEIVSWAKMPDPLSEPYIVICDEAHAMQSMSSARTKNALKLMLGKKVLGTLLLTGTPLKVRIHLNVHFSLTTQKNGQPSNLFPLLKAVKHPFGEHQKAYEMYFCEGRQVQMGPKVVWMAKGAAHLNQLRECTKSHVLYLTKDECLQLPPHTRTTRKIPVSSRNELIHKEGLQRLSKAYFQDRGHNPDALLGAFQNLRLSDAWAKVDATVQVAKEILERQPAVVVFTSFQQIAGMIAQKLKEAGWPAELLTGNTSVAKRPVAVDNFQNGLSPAFVATFGAGGVGLTLTAASTIILVDRPWTPGEAFQAEDRVRRIGQTKPVTSIWISAFDLDEQIDQLLQSKKQTSDAVLSGNGSQDLGGMQRISILKLLEKVLPRM